MSDATRYPKDFQDDEYVNDQVDQQLQEDADWLEPRKEP